MALFPFRVWLRSCPRCRDGALAQDGSVKVCLRCGFEDYGPILHVAPEGRPVLPTEGRRHKKGGTYDYVRKADFALMNVA